MIQHRRVKKLGERLRGKAKDRMKRKRAREKLGDEREKEREIIRGEQGKGEGMV